jgi:hypothetical protein
MDQWVGDTTQGILGIRPLKKLWLFGLNLSGHPQWSTKKSPELMQKNKVMEMDSSRGFIN